MEISTVPSTPPPAMGTNAREVPAAAPPEKQKEKEEKETIQPTETLMERAFRLKKVA
jgi:hypothetical protein